MDHRGWHGYVATSGHVDFVVYQFLQFHSVCNVRFNYRIFH